MNEYDIIIIGAGISGLMTSYQLLQNNSKVKIAIIEQGREITNRTCFLLKNKEFPCQHCNSCSIMSGEGGAGAFSDGKFIITTEYGGYLQEYIGVDNANNYMTMLDKILQQYGLNVASYQDNSIIQKLCTSKGLQFKKGIVKHIGTENTFILLSKIINELKKKCSFYTLHTVVNVDPNKKIVNVVHNNSHLSIKAKKIIFAVGRSGNDFFKNWCLNNSIKLFCRNVDIGVRVELPNNIWKELTDIIYDPKISYKSSHYQDETRMFCFNVGGEVIIENSNNGLTVNGHAYSKTKTNNSNFALLSSIKLSDPFNDPIEYVKNIVKNANLLSNNNVIIQKFDDLIQGKRSTKEKINSSKISPTLPSAYPGDLSLCMPKRYLDNIIETIFKLDEIAPGTAGKETFLYGIEAKYYSLYPEIKDFMLTDYNDIYVCGDGCGITRSLAQAGANGLCLADIISNSF